MSAVIRRAVIHRAVVLLSLLLPAAAFAHHGVATPGAVGVSGPGAPLETSSSATLPQGSWLAYMKLDHASYDLLTPERDDETKRTTYQMFGLGYGVTPWLSLYGFLPFHAKTAEDNGFNTAGFVDPAWLAVAGFTWDGGPRPVDRNESLDDLEDLHFALWLGGTLPLGDPDTADADGLPDPGKALGFGEPSWSVGAAATRWLGRWTLVAEASTVLFQEHEYADGQRVAFGTETRLSLAACATLWTRPSSRTRLDLNLEAGYLALGRDEADGVGEAGTGGRILYALPGLRLTRGTVSLGLGWKTPAWTDLNEDALQQGAEGKESGRLLATFSTLF
ncbi:MAG TPA: transporter [Candidatus Krumholzibacteria bacterium]|nr:transporter [Candidatus Krumholzibacteria bacterium]